MPKQKRHKTKYPGVYYIKGQKKGAVNQTEKIFYYYFRKTVDGKSKIIEEKAGRENSDDMTDARAAKLRLMKIDGELPTNAEKRSEIEAIKKAQDEKWTIDRLWEKYSEGRKPGKALITDKSRYKKYLKPVFGNQEPSEIIALDVDRLRLSLLKEKSPQTVKHVLNLLTWICNYGVKSGLCAGLSFHVKKPEVNNTTTEDLSKNQISNLLKAIEEDKHPMAGNMMKLALYSGLRRGEMFKLKWADVDFDRGFIHIRNPKGGQNAKVPLNDASRELLLSIVKSEGSPYVFPGRDGKERTNICDAVNDIKKKAKLPPNFRPLHGLRHVFASGLASSGEVDMYTLQKLLTHKSPIMTQRYAHLRDEALKNASNIASSLFKVEEKDKKKTVG